MISRNSLNYIISVVIILLQSNQFLQVECIHALESDIPTETVIQAGSINDTIVGCRREIIDANVAWLIFFCSPHSTAGIASEIRANVTHVHCVNDTVIEANDVKFIKFDGCTINSLPNGLLGNFEHINTIDASGLSLDVRRVEDIPLPNKLDKYSVQLNLSSNLFTSLESAAFFYLKPIQHLYLADNRLQHVDTNAFHELTNLVELDLARNALVRIPERTFVRVRELKILHLNGNQLQSIGDHWFTEENVLKRLDMSNNRITWWRSSSLKNLHQLEYLNFSSNAIPEIPAQLFEGLSTTQVEYFHMNNEVVEMPITWPGRGNQLKILDLSHNQLVKLHHSSFENLQNLTDMDLCGNSIVEITASTFVHLTQLRRLNLSDNRIQRIDSMWFGVMNEVENLNLGNNLIINLKSDIFERLVNLTDLNLKGNRIKQLPQGIFTQLKNLKYLCLGDNHNIKIDALWFSEKSISEYFDVLLCKNLTELTSSFSHLKTNAMGGNVFECKETNTCPNQRFISPIRN